MVHSRFLVKVSALALLVCALGAFAACGPSSNGGRANTNGNGDGGINGPHTLKGLQVTPGSAVLFIDNMMPATQAFTATEVYEDGNNTDVTAMATFTVEKPTLGSFPSANNFTSTTTGGFTKVFAQVGTLQGYTIVTLVPRRLDAMGNPLDFFFIAPYNMPTTPDSAILTFGTNIKQADVGFLIDTTGSMGGKITNLHTSLSALAATLKTTIPSVAMGVSNYRSWPCSPDGSVGDYVFQLNNRIVTVMSGGLTAIQNSIGTLSAGGGGDGPECGFDALYAATSGLPLNNCNGNGSVIVPAFNATTAPGSVTGEMTGTIGGMGFRTGSLPVMVLATDAELHDGEDPLDTTFAPIRPYAKGHTSALAALNAIGGRFVGIASTSGGADFSPNFAGPSVTGSWEPYSQMLWLAQQTHSVVPVSAFANACGTNMCCTGVSGAAVAPDSMGNCAMVYKIDATGNGLGTSVADAISKLVTFGGYDDSTSVTGITTDESMPGVPLPGTHTTADFLSPVDMERGVTPLDSTPAVGAPGGPASIDTTKNAFIDVPTGTSLRFTVKAYNDFVPGLDTPQFFKASISVLGNGAALLDQRDVYILVPPSQPSLL